MQRDTVWRFGLRLAGVLALGAVHVLGRNPAYSPLQASLAGLMAASFLIVADVERRMPRHHPPVLVWVLLQVYVFFGMPVFVSADSYNRVLPWSLMQAEGGVDRALWGACVVTAGILVGFALVRMRLSPRASEASGAPTRSLPVGLLALYAFLSIIIAFVLRRYEWEVKLKWFRAPLGMIFSPIVAQALVAFEWQRGGRGSGWLALFALVTASAAVAGLLLGRMSHAFFPIAFYVVVRYARERRVQARVIAAALVLFFLFNPVKILYRGQAGYRTSKFAHIGAQEMLEIWVESFQDVWGGEGESKEHALDASVKRLSFMETNAVVMTRTPHEIPYAEGETWRAIPFSVIPRILWPEKPDMTQITNDVFSVRFGLSTEAGTERSTMAYPSIADGYWNFGMWGVLLVGILGGFFWGAVAIAWSARSRRRYVVSLVLLFEVKSVVALPGLLIGIPQQLVALMVVVLGLEFIGSMIAGSGSPGRQARGPRFHHGSGSQP